MIAGLGVRHDLEGVRSHRGDRPQSDPAAPGVEQHRDRRRAAKLDKRLRVKI